MQLVQDMARQASPESVRYMIEVRDDPKEDVRARMFAADKIYTWAWGLPKVQPDAQPALRDLPLEQQRQRVREILARAAAVVVPPDFRPTEVIEAAPGDNDDQLE